MSVPSQITICTSKTSQPGQTLYPWKMGTCLANPRRAKVGMAKATGTISSTPISKAIATTKARNIKKVNQIGDHRQILANFVVATIGTMSAEKKIPMLHSSSTLCHSIPMQPHLHKPRLRMLKRLLHALQHTAQIASTKRIF